MWYASIRSLVQFVGMFGYLRSKSWTRLRSARSTVLCLLVLVFFSSWVCQTTQATTWIKETAWFPPVGEDEVRETFLKNCPLPLENLSKECEEAMDEHFANHPLDRTSDSTWILLPNRLTYGRAFKDPTGDRNRVFEALRERDCRLEEGEVVQWELAESCQASTFANLSVFLWACSKYDFLQNLPEYLVDISDYTDFENSDPQLYRHVLRTRNMLILEALWLRKKCAKHKVAEMQIDSLLDQEQYQILRSTAERLGDIWPEYSDVPESFVLKSLAARLGDSSAALLYDGTFARGRVDSWREYMGKVWPWKDSLGEFHDYTNPNSLDRLEKTSKRLQVGVSIAAALLESGLEFDWKFLVRRVCTLKNSEEANCKTAIEELDPTYDWEQESELQVLEEFKRVSRELNLYD
ncbi:MAG: hypothetical protein OXG24_00555 [Gammaproteobacteria bacterium]|nr:hypothetical protein [Gammaproteobacteria bacterium]